MGLGAKSFPFLLFFKLQMTHWQRLNEWSPWKRQKHLLFLSAETSEQQVNSPPKRRLASLSKRRGVISPLKFTEKRSSLFLTCHPGISSQTCASVCKSTVTTNPCWDKCRLWRAEIRNKDLVCRLIQLVTSKNVKRGNEQGDNKKKNNPGLTEQAMHRFS